MAIYKVLIEIYNKKGILLGSDKEIINTCDSESIFYGIKSIDKLRQIYRDFWACGKNSLEKVVIKGIEKISK